MPAHADPAHVPQRAPEPSPKHVKTAHSRPAKGAAGAHAHDPERVISLLLRDITVRSATALRGTGEQREAELLVAAVELRQAFQEAANVASLGGVDWAHLQHELVSAFAAKRALTRALTNRRFNDVKVQLTEASWEVRRAVPHNIAATIDSTPAVPVAAVDSNDRVALVHLLLATCRQRASRFRGLHTEAPKAAQQVCMQLATDLGSATDAVLAVEDRQARSALKPDIDALEEEVEWMSSFLAQTPKFKWHKSYASMFEAANALRKVAGLAAKPRAYSGSIDPVDALKQAESLAKGLSGNVAEVRFEDPQAAVAGITAGIRAIYAQQQLAIDNLNVHLTEKDPPRMPSIGMRLLKLAVEQAITAASAYIGSLVLRGVQSAFTNRTKQRIESNEYLERLLKNDEYRARMMGDAMKDGAAGRAFVAGLASKSASALFTFGGTAAKDKIFAATPSSLVPLVAFTQLQQQGLAKATHTADLQLAHLQAALVQADVEALNALSALISGNIVGQAYGIQYDQSLKSWLDFEAHLATGTESDGKVDLLKRDDVPGTLEVTLQMDPDAHAKPRMSSMTLHGGEPAARRRMRALAQPLRSAGLHTRYVVHFRWGYGGHIELIRAQDRAGLISGYATSDLERALLRLRVAGQPLNASTVSAAKNEGSLAFIPDSVAEWQLETDMRAMNLSTYQIEES
jgi:hypothetical protein